MGKNVVIIGSQWGDEGKGKVVDLLTESADAVIRFQGGNNAGHTIVIDGKTTALRLVPSGAMRQEVQCLIGNGVVVNPGALLDEIRGLEQNGIELRHRLHISQACPLVMPYHLALDQARERTKGKKSIGTTGRGIGPAYEDKVARQGLRMADLFHPKRFAEKLHDILDYHNFVLNDYYKAKTLNTNQVLDEVLSCAEQLKPMIGNLTERLADYQQQGKNLLFEGAQGTFLDIDHGTYPFVTSSNTTAGGVSTGSGFGPRYLDYILGITKAYTTRVGAGPFPSELHDDIGKRLAERGHEFGTNTERPRRCGWFDAAMVKHAVQINSFSGLCMTKLDVLDGLDSVKICVAYRYQHDTFTAPPADVEILAACEPVYEEMPGWQENCFGLTNRNDLPDNAIKYLNRLEELVGVPIDIISTGPDRNETILLHDPFH